MKKGLSVIICICIITACFSGNALGAAETEKPQAKAEEAAEEATEEATEEAAKEVQNAGGHQDGRPSPDGVWEQEGEDWFFKLPDGTYLKRDWVLDGGKWFYLDEDSYMAIGTLKIRGEYYYFRENGEMAVGWAYDEDASAWYLMNEDGTRKTGWYEAGGVWYWFDSKGIMYTKGFRMIDGHKYYFFENGQMAAGTYIGLNYYDLNGLRNRQYDITIQGKRKPTEEEKDAVSKAMEGIPGEWMEKCLKAGWEFMFYTDKDFFEAPNTDQGVYYIYHKTDINYKKIKFTKPESLKLAFGEYLAHATGNDKEGNGFMTDFEQYLTETSLVQPLPSYFDDKPEAWFGLLFGAYCDTDIFYDIRKQSPDLAAFMAEALGINQAGRRPALEELRDVLYEESEGELNLNGPSTDEELKKSLGPASDKGAA